MSQQYNQLNPPAELIPSDPRFGVGPSLIPQSHLDALAKTGSNLLGTSHRKPAVKKLVAELQKNLKQYFQVPDDYVIALGNGGATFLWDMIGLGMVEHRSQHFVCGEFSKKWFQAHHNIPWIAAEEQAADFGKGVDPSFTADADVIACTLNETSTGVQIKGLPQRSPADDHKLLCVDATSGAGQIPVDMSQVDIYYFSPQKILAGEGGLFISFLSPRAVERARKIKEDNTRFIPIIMNWKLCIDNALANQTYNTPSVSNLFLVNEQVKAMLEFGGESKVTEEAKRKAALVYQWAQEKNYLTPYVSDSEYRSQSVATINVKDDIPVEPLIKHLREKGWVYDIDAYRKLGQNQFRISLFHNVTRENLEKLCKLISYYIEH